jgi:uncharacterized protein YlaN (UPF0358 family)
MQITELLKLTVWFEDNIVTNGIPQKYQALYNRMQQNVNSQKQPFENELKVLFDALKELNLNTLTLEQVKFLTDLEIDDLITVNAIEKIKDILHDFNLDIATATKKIQEFSQKINTAQTRLKEIRTVLEKSFSIEDESEIPEDSVLMRVYFQEGSAIKDIKDLKKLSTTWYDIGRGISMAQNRSPEDFKIIGAEKGSLIIEMAVYAGLATSVSTILLAGLKVAERVIELLKKVEELKALKLKNKQIQTDLLKEVEEEKTNGIKSILDFTIERLGLNQEQEGDKITALEKSITKLVDFTQKGGAVDFVQPEEDENEEENENNREIRDAISKLSENVQEIRSLENKIKMIEGKKDE